MSGSVECPECGCEYNKIGNHWHHNDHRPQLTNKQRDVVSGLLMGDGCLGRNSQNPFLVASMISPNYLEYLDELFGIHGTGVTLYKTAKEIAEEDAGRDFGGCGGEENYHDVYRWNTRTHPDFHDFNWYTGNNGNKVWPKDITLTPTVLKHWYVCDGSWYNTGSHNRIEIAASNELGNSEKITQMFDRVGLPTPTNYRTQERRDGSMKFDIRFSSSGTDELFEYMGSALPDFQYKWPAQYH